MTSRTLWLALTLSCALATAPAFAAPDEASTEKLPWSHAHPSVVADVARGRPLVVRAIVPLCSNDQIDCGGTAAGRAGDLDRNLYWGAIFGVRRMFDRKRSGWTRVDSMQPQNGPLERIVYRRYVAAKRWGLGAKHSPVEQLVVLDAVHGDDINRAVDGFWSLATTGGDVTFTDGGKKRTVTVHVAGYSGHNRLMDGVDLPKVAPKPAAPRHRRRMAMPSFVLACYSEAYFSESLNRAGSRPLVMTRALMAPEGYVLDAVVRALGDNATEVQLRRRVVSTYAKWQKLTYGTSSAIFSR